MENAFSNSPVTHLSFPSDSHVEEICGSAFLYSNMASIDLPLSCRRIYPDSFIIRNAEPCVAVSIKKSCKYFIETVDKCVCRVHPPEVIQVSLNKRHFTIRESFTCISAHAFLNHPTLTTIHFPSSLVSIGFSAFYGCAHLKRITFSQDSHIETICTFAFANSPIKRVDFPSSIRTLQESCFSHCYKLRIITFPKDSNLEKICEGVFLETPLRTISFPASLKEIGGDAFAYCRKLQRISFPDDSKLESVKTFTFLNDFKLNDVFCPQSKINILVRDKIMKKILKK